jgi:hypothetical protein
MPETEAFQLAAPTEEDLVIAEAAWRSGESQYPLSTADHWWRVLRAPTVDDARDFAATWYPSPSQTRFAPLFKAGEIVPAAYAGRTRTVSLWEVVLRASRHLGVRRIREHETRDRYLIKVRLARVQRLLDIRRPRDLHLVSVGKRAPNLSAAWPVAYPLTRSWAQALYDRLPEIDGIIYESHQVSGDCVVLYQRADTETTLFQIEDKPRRVRSGSTRSLLLSEARKSGIAVDFGEDPSEDDEDT